MSTHETKAFLAKNRKALIIGGGVGVCLLVAWVGYDFAMTPSMPTIQSAHAGDVVKYVSNERGLSGLARVEQQRFLDQWREHLLSEDAHRKELTDHMLAMEKDDRRRFVDAIAGCIKDAVIDDARSYNQIRDEAERYKFLRRKVLEFRSQSQFVKELGSSLKDDFSGRDELEHWVAKNVKPEEQTLGEVYLQDLKRVSMQITKEERAPKPGPKEPGA